MTRRKARSTTLPVIVSVTLSAGILAYGVTSVDAMTLDTLARKLLWPLLRLMGFICLGLLVGQVIEATGWTRTLAAAAMPLFRFGRLGPQCSAAFTTAFFSGVAANSMLNEFYRSSKITRKQLFLANFVNQLPAFFLHLPTTFFIVIPLTGWAGGLYFAITFLATLLRTFALLIYGHHKLPKPSDPMESQSLDSSRRSAGATDGPASIYRAIAAKLPRRLTHIAVYVVPIYIAVFFLNSLGAFHWLRNAMADYVVTSFIPIESLSVVILSLAAEFTSGFAAAGALLEAGVLTVKQTVLALLIGNVIAFPVRALRHQLPHYIGIYSPKMGTQLLLLGQTLRITSLILVGVVYYIIG